MFSGVFSESVEGWLLPIAKYSYSCLLPPSLPWLQWDGGRKRNKSKKPSWLRLMWFKKWRKKRETKKRQFFFRPPQADWCLASLQTINSHWNWFSPWKPVTPSTYFYFTSDFVADHEIIWWPVWVKCSVGIPSLPLPVSCLCPALLTGGNRGKGRQGDGKTFWCPSSLFNNSQNIGVLPACFSQKSKTEHQISCREVS